ncbi:septal ring lytic transglycosylase RlpA family protein [Dactylosporangium sp. AC04546]|uniref:septal ring lytic transglycosylase RlpA family protein n=1 Tax=Dactylosporangium sp. AC04546 TaxID=2862460 RepID=UPI001EDF02EE|nr:septal ring lytic transglycosylase RlpA family protein [Dactylosporangium sp. AC04546]WVK83966.1 septal ring lytic transglycosylase RlpA family protein [Dactylosporangium sp. AC04546]
MSGKHSAQGRRLLVPLIAGIVATVALVGVAVTTINLRSGSSPATAGDVIDVSRSPEARADRDDRPSPSAAASSPQVTRSPEATTTPSKKTTAGSTGTCKASYYATGSKTANGEKFDPDGLTAAHKTLPFNTKVRVTNLANGKSVVVRINDRGPFVTGRCLDLARGAFVQVASVSAGVINARYEVLK